MPCLEYLKTAEHSQHGSLLPLCDIKLTFSCIHHIQVLQGHIGLALAKFPEDTPGIALDILARGPLWNMGLDYAHGTGHGVGAHMAVHEGDPFKLPMYCVLFLKYRDERYDVKFIQDTASYLCVNVLVTSISSVILSLWVRRKERCCMRFVVEHKFGCLVMLDRSNFNQPQIFITNGPKRTQDRDDYQQRAWVG